MSPSEPGLVDFVVFLGCPWPLWLLESFLPLFFRIPQALRNSGQWVSASGSISCWIKTLWWCLCKTKFLICIFIFGFFGERPSPFSNPWCRCIGYQEWLGDCQHRTVSVAAFRYVATLQYYKVKKKKWRQAFGVLMRGAVNFSRSVYVCTQSFWDALGPGTFPRIRKVGHRPWRKNVIPDILYSSMWWI